MDQTVAAAHVELAQAQTFAYALSASPLASPSVPRTLAVTMVAAAHAEYAQMICSATTAIVLHASPLALRASAELTVAAAHAEHV